MTERQRSITCPQCKRTSWNPNDVFQRYCGNCKMFHDDMPPPLPWWKQPVSMPRWIYLCSVATAWVIILSVLFKFYNEWDVKRQLRACVAEHLYRCDIGDSKVFITYNGDMGPDE